MYCVVFLKSFYESSIGDRCVDVDFYRFIGKSFTVELFFPQGSSEVIHHVAIVGNIVYIYRGWFVYTRLRGLITAYSCVRGGSRCLDIVIGKIRELCKGIW
jgi:hypothetical protein